MPEKKDIRNPLRYLLIKAAQRAVLLLNYMPHTSPQATSRRQSQNWSKAFRRAINSRLY